MKRIIRLIIGCFIVCVFSSCEKEYKDYFYATKPQLNNYDDYYYFNEEIMNQWSIQDTIKIYNSDGCDISVANPNQIIPYLAKFNRNKIGDPPYIGFYPGNISFSMNAISFPSIIDGSITKLPMMVYKDGPLDTLKFSFRGLIEIICLDIVTKDNIYIDSINVSLENVFMNGIFYIKNENDRSDPSSPYYYDHYYLTHYDFDEKGTNTIKINVQDSIQNKIFYIPVPKLKPKYYNNPDYGKLTVILFTNEGIIKKTTKESIQFDGYDGQYHCNVFLDI